MDDQVPSAQPVPATPPQVGQATPDPVAATPTPTDEGKATLELKSKDPIDLFGNNIFELLGMENAPADKKNSLVQSMVETIQSRILGRVLDKLNEDPEGLKEFERLLDTGPQEAVEQFLESKGLDLGQMTAEETLLYKTEFLGKMTSPAEAPDPVSTQNATPASTPDQQG